MSGRRGLAASGCTILRASRSFASRPKATIRRTSHSATMTGSRFTSPTSARWCARASTSPAFRRAEENRMGWKFDLVAGPYKGRTGGLAWDGKGMLFSAVAEERIFRYDPSTEKTEQFRWFTGRTNGLAVAKDGTVFGAQEGGRRIIHFLKDGSTAPTEELLDGAHHNQPVDLVIDSTGRLWIADAYNSQPPYGPPAYPFLPHASVLRMDNYGPRLYRLSRVTHDTAAPRAVLLSYDEKTLYVADGDVERGDVCQLFAYPLDKHGVAGHRKTLF